MVSWCVDKASTRFEEFAKAEYYTISVLTDQQQELSNLFAMRSWDETVFDDADWYEGHNGVPQLNDVSSRFHCKTAHVYEGGDHLIIVGSVLDYECDASEPLVFFQGDYRKLV